MATSRPLWYQSRVVPGYEVRYPRMPNEGDPGYARWSAAIRREMADLDDDADVVGHSVGAAILVNALAEQPPERGLGAIVLIAAPFVGEGGWTSDEFELTSDLRPADSRALPVEDLLPQDVCVPAVLGEFAQYVEVHPAQRKRAAPVAVDPVVQPQG